MKEFKKLEIEKFDLSLKEERSKLLNKSLEVTKLWDDKKITFMEYLRVKDLTCISRKHEEIWSIGFRRILKLGKYSEIKEN